MSDFTEQHYQDWVAKGLVVEQGKRRPRSQVPPEPKTPSLPLSDPEPGEVVFPFDLVNKSNTYCVHFQDRVQPAIQEIKRKFKGGWLWRVAPSEEARNAEQALAIELSQRIAVRIPAGRPVRLWLRVIGRGFDIDAVKSILDAFQQARIVENDNQFKELWVRVEDGPPSLGARIEVISH